MKIHIHENCQEAVNQQSIELLSLVQSSMDQPPPALPPEEKNRFFPVATFNRADMTNISEEIRIPGIGVASRRKLVGNMWHGFDEVGYRSLRLLAEKIQKQKDVKDKVSMEALTEVVLDWAVDRHLGRTDQSLCQRVIEEFESRIKPRWMWVTAFGIFCNIPFELGRTTIHHYSPEFFQKWELVLQQRGRGEDATSQAQLRYLRPKLQGHCACTMRIEAEPIRAKEIALEEAENALAMLRLYLPSIAHPLVPSYCKPRDAKDLETSTTLYIENDEVLGYRDDNDDVQVWQFTEEQFREADSHGLGQLHRLYLQEKRSEFEEELLKSLFTFSRSSIQKDASDRLVYVFRALDSFLLKDSIESIQQNIGDRIAFVVSKDATERKDIADQVKDVYALRSRFVHHNQSIKDIELIVKFLHTVMWFYDILLMRHKEFKTRQEFFAAIEALKYA